MKKVKLKITKKIKNSACKKSGCSADRLTLPYMNFKLKIAA